MCACEKKRERGRPSTACLHFAVNVYRKVGIDKLAVGARGEGRELPRGEVGGSSWSLEHGCCGLGELSVVLKV